MHYHVWLRKLCTNLRIVISYPANPGRDESLQKAQKWQVLNLEFFAKFSIELFNIRGLIPFPCKHNCR